MKNIFCFISFLFIAFHSFSNDTLVGQAYPDSTFRKSVNFRSMVQFWSAFTMSSSNRIESDNKLDFFFRRARIGLDGSLTSKMDYLVLFAYDNLGRDKQTGALGALQPTSNRELYLWDGFVTYRLQPTYLNVTFGYFRPQICRENLTSAFQVSSLDKNLTNFYPRLYYTGRATGRETGVNVGGLIKGEELSLNYNFGVFDANFETINGNSASNKNASLLYTGRAALSVGDPELEKYSIAYKSNYFGTRRGLTFGFNYGYNGATNETWDNVRNAYLGGFKKSEIIAADLLFNWDRFSMDAEYDILARTNSDTLLTAHADKMKGNHFSDLVKSLRLAYTYPWKKNHIELSAMYSDFIGHPNSLLFPSGTDVLIDAGINYYIDKQNMKVQLHYVKSSGNAVSLYDSGNAQRGNLLCLGFQYLY